MTQDLVLFTAFGRRVGVLWWIGLLCLAEVLVGGLEVRTMALTAIGACAFALGAQGSRPLEGGQSQVVRGRRSQAEIRFHWEPYFLFALIGYQCLLLRGAVEGIAELGVRFRESYYEGGAAGSSIAFVLYENFMIPVGIYAVARWLASRKKIGLWLVASVLFFVLDAALKAGRFPLYFLLFFLILARVLGVIRIRAWAMALSATVMFGFAVAISAVRENLALDDQLVAAFLKSSFVNYHVIGFFLFERISQSALFADALGAGVYTLGFWPYAFSLLARRFGYDIAYAQQPLNLSLSSDWYFPGLGTYNAFGTNLLPLYLDAGYLGVALGFYVLGRLVAADVRSNGEVHPVNIVALFIMVFGVFQPLIMTAYFGVPVVLALLDGGARRLLLSVTGWVGQSE